MPRTYKYRGPNEEETRELARLLKEVPTQVVEVTEWGSPQGRVFLKALREVQLRNVGLPQLAEALGVPAPTLAGAVRTWERKPPAKRAKRVRKPRPLGRASG